MLDFYILCVILYQRLFYKGLAPKEAMVFPNNYTIRDMNLHQRLSKMLNTEVVVRFGKASFYHGTLTEVGEDYVVIGETIFPHQSTIYIAPVTPPETFFVWLKSLFGH